MNNLKEKQQINLLPVESYSPQNNLSGEVTTNLSAEINFNFLQVFNKINELIRYISEPENLVKEFFNEIKTLIEFESYFVSLYIDNEPVLTSELNFSEDLKQYLIDGGVFRLVLEERKSLSLEYPNSGGKCIIKKLLVVPYVLSKNNYAIFCLTLMQKNIFTSSFALIEAIFSLVGSHLITKTINNKAKNLEAKIFELNDYLNKEINQAVVSKVFSKSFHYLKNRTQVLVSSFNLIQKIVANYKDERLEKVLQILSSEVPEYSRAIRMISDFAKVMTNDSKPIYFEFYMFITDIQNLMNLTGISKEMKLTISPSISKSKIYGYYYKLLQAFILLILELYDNGSTELEIESQEEANRLITKLRITNITNHDGLRSLLDENSNVKFVQVKNLFMQNFCKIISYVTSDSLEIFISLPKRSSVFNDKVVTYAKNFNS